MSTVVGSRSLLVCNRGASSHLSCLPLLLSGFHSLSQRKQALLGIACLPDLGFVDDIIALAESNCNHQNLVTSISDYAEGPDHTINSKKTKNMLTGNQQHDTDV